MKQSVIDRPEIACALLCGAVGFGLYGVESGVLWVIVGYFLGKSIESLFWTLTGGLSS
ncbi:hypothetical protein [Halomicrobium mukohataei]|uniref:Uncharacterized protein n=1 Tax=Halomicrobium mukohataei (strain ATCC 700874 / DSM 12286 / JCM 9738 / NCIMB 13541) TaxID=485914 RepID=C7P4T6_HALMD|nr:hypothetical protein [Halomicrobium mukohataei]ACV49331.1 hypothetical protein Hmuk_3228 [Halomicrobium mukohataei DSM 12286]